jgi:hypothetical protein
VEDNVRVLILKQLCFILAACILCAGLAGCSDNLSPDDYSHLWRDAAEKYRAIDKNPDNAGADQQSEINSASNISTQIRAIANSMQDLKAPTDFQELQDETYLFYRGQADDYSGYSQALASGDTNKIATTATTINNFVGEHEQKITQIIGKLGGKPDMFQQSWNSVLKDVPAK